MHLFTRCLLAVLIMCFATLASASTSMAVTTKAVDKVLVLKAERQLQLLHRGNLRGQRHAQTLAGELNRAHTHQAI